MTTMTTTTEELCVHGVLHGFSGIVSPKCHIASLEAALEYIAEDSCERELTGSCYTNCSEVYPQIS